MDILGEEHRIVELHRDLMRSLKKDPTHIAKEISPVQLDLWHMATGVCTEAGELLGAVKKYAVYGAPLDFENVVEELGDLEFYMAGLRDALGISRQATLHHNIVKLRKRYPNGGYTNEDAINRNDKTEGADG